MLHRAAGRGFFRSLVVGATVSVAALFVPIGPSAQALATRATQTWTLAQQTYTRFPINCGAVPLQMLESVNAEPQIDTYRVLILVQCGYGAGYGPTELLVYRGQLLGSGQPVPAQVLVSASSGWIPDPNAKSGPIYMANDGDIEFRVAGFSRSDLDSARPDVSTTLSWRWAGGQYQLEGSPPAHVPS